MARGQIYRNDSISRGIPDHDLYYTHNFPKRHLNSSKKNLEVKTPDGKLMQVLFSVIKITIQLIGFPLLFLFFTVPNWLIKIANYPAQIISSTVDRVKEWFNIRVFEPLRQLYIKFEKKVLLPARERLSWHYVRILNYSKEKQKQLYDFIEPKYARFVEFYFYYYLKYTALKSSVAAKVVQFNATVGQLISSPIDSGREFVKSSSKRVSQGVVQFHEKKEQFRLASRKFFIYLEKVADELTSQAKAVWEQLLQRFKLASDP